MDIQPTRPQLGAHPHEIGGRPDVATLTTAVARYHAAALRAMTGRGIPFRNLRELPRGEPTCDMGVLGLDERLLSTGSLRVEAPTHPHATPAPDPRAREAFGHLQALASHTLAHPGGRELAYGFPLIHGRLAGGRGPGRTICAPLIVRTVRLRTAADGSILIEAGEVPPLVNVAMWGDGLGPDRLALLTERCRDAQADLAHGFSIERLNLLLAAMRSVLPELAPTDVTAALSPWPEGDGADEHALTVTPAAALFPITRASPHLVGDLEKLADDPHRHLDRGGPLAVLMNPPSHEARPRLVTPGEERVLYPFASNGPQRRVLDALTRNELVVVQGPPGTGKSQTIANLVAHLVARGQRVLVTSHKTQALVAVRDLLARLEVRFLVGGLVGDGPEARERLHGEIDRLAAFAARAEPGTLDRELERLEGEHAATAAQYAAACAQLIDGALPDQARAVEMWERIGSTPTPPLDDRPVPPAERPAVVAALREHDRIARRHAPALIALSALGPPEPDRMARVTGLLDWAEASRTAHLGLDRHPQARPAMERWLNSPALNADNLATAAELIDRAERLLAPLLSGLGEFGSAGESIHRHGRRLAADPVLRRHTREQLARMATLVERARGDMGSRNLLRAPARLRGRIAGHRHETEHGGRLSRRRSRRWLNRYAPAALTHRAAAVTAWARFWDTWHEMTLTMARTPSPLVTAGLLATTPDIDALADTVVHLEAACTLADTLATVRDLGRECDLKPPIEALIACRDSEDLAASASAHRLAVAALEHRLSQPQPVPGSPEAALLTRLIPAAHGDTELSPRLHELRDALEPYVGWATTDRAAMAAVPAAAEAVRRVALAGQPAPTWLAEGPDAFARHAAALRLTELATTETPTDIAARIEEHRRRLAERARDLLALRVQHNLLQALHTPAFLTGLDSLHGQIDPSGNDGHPVVAPGEPSPAATAFPCWLLRPEEASRLFPLDAAPIDVVIIDEASQCNPDVALPLFARARRVIVFGDDKQLSNEDLVMSLSATQNAALRAQMGLEHLDAEGRFDELAVSLLGASARRQQAQVMLSEHFRCRPEIVAFSNRRFYAGALRVMRDPRDHRGLINPILVRELTEADELPRGRVNEAEAEALVADLQRRLRDPRYAGLSFGVLSLFREQVDYIDRRIAQEIPAELAARHRLICATVDGFQGDERDVVYYSWRYTGDSSAQLFNFAQGAAGARRINVALTRARHQMIHFISAPPTAFPPSATNVTDFLRLAANPPTPAPPPPPPTAPATHARLAEILTEGGLRVGGGIRVAGVSIDMTATPGDDDRQVAIICDAEPRPTASVDTPDPVEAHALLTRAGWCVTRVAATEILTNPARALERVHEALAAAPRRPPADRSEPAHMRLLHEGSGESAGRPGPPAPLGAEGPPDHRWSPPPVTVREAGGEPVFANEIARELHRALVGRPGLVATPRWPVRDRFIDLVLTDRRGGRLAVMVAGDGAADPPADADHVAALEEAGWPLLRLSPQRWRQDREGALAEIEARLAQVPADPALAVDGGGRPSAEASFSTRPAAGDGGVDWPAMA